MGYDFDQLFPGRFLKSGQFKGKDVTLTVAGIRLEDMPDEKGVRTKAIVAFRETKLEFLLNRTNGECLKAMFGRQTDDWIGKRVTLYPATIIAFGETDVGIRVRGSPDLEKDMPIEITLPRKKPTRVTMKRTASAKANGKAQKLPDAPAPATAPAATEEPPPFDAETGEVPFS